jgi:hypothetical protein
MLLRKLEIRLISACIIIFCTAMATSCDDTTDDVGHSLIDNMDKLNISTDTFNVQSRSVVVDSVLSRTITNYLGKIRDLETGTYVTCNYATQFRPVSTGTFPKQDSIISVKDGKVIADSCDVCLYYTSFYGDSLTTMKLNALEMGKPMSEGVQYYSSFNPETEGFIKRDGFNVSKSYALADLSLSLDYRSSSSYSHNIQMQMNGKYTDKDGNEYNNLGTYLMRKYYEDSKNFSNSYNFVHNVFPGIYFKNSGGLGAMAYVYLTQLNVYYKYTYEDSIQTGCTSFSGTEEILSSTNVKNNKSKLESLAEDNSCTYIKSPSGIYTEVTLPVEKIMYGHDEDSINAAKLVLTCKANTVDSKYNFKAPTTLLLLPKDSLRTFFEKNDVANYKTSFITTLSTTYNNYTFSNIGALIKEMYKRKQSGNITADWNKVAVVPVEVTYTTVSSSSVLTRVVNDMSIKSAKLVKGTDDENSPLTISVIYSKFNK